MVFCSFTCIYVRIDAYEEHYVGFFTQYFCILPPHYTVTNIVSHCFTFQFQRLLEEAAVEKERLVMELQYVIFLVLDALDINDGVHE